MDQLVLTNIYTYVTTRLPPLLSSKESACDTADAGSIPGSGRSPGRWHGNPLQYSCLENPMGRRTWRTTVHRVTKNWNWLKWLSTHISHQLISSPLFNFMRSILLWFSFEFCWSWSLWLSILSSMHFLISRYQNLPSAPKELWEKIIPPFLRVKYVTQA